MDGYLSIGLVVGFFREPAPVEADGEVVLGERPREGVSPRVVGDEIEVLGGGRPQGGDERCFAGVGNGTGWQARMKIGIVRGI